MSENPFASPETEAVPKAQTPKIPETDGVLTKEYFYEAKQLWNSTFFCFLALIFSLSLGLPAFGILLAILFPSLGLGILGPIIVVVFISILLILLALPVSYRTYLKLKDEPALMIWNDGVTVLFTKMK